jgi:hypothetical protein
MVSVSEQGQEDCRRIAQSPRTPHLHNQDGKNTPPAWRMHGASKRYSVPINMRQPDALVVLRNMNDLKETSGGDVQLEGELLVPIKHYGEFALPTHDQPKSRAYR